MSAVQTRTFELMSTVTFHGISADAITPFSEKLARAVGQVISEFPAIVAFLVEPDVKTGDINFGLRFQVIDPDVADDWADEVLEKAVQTIAADEGVKPVEAEREESVLVLTR